MTPGRRQLAFVAVLLILAGYGTMRVTGRIPAGADQGDPLPAPTLPPGIDDPLNRAVLIEGGTFMRGSDDPRGSDIPAGPQSGADEYPASPETVGGFWIQEHEVTNEEYRRFDSSHEFPEGEERHPVVRITWEEAMAYARSIGGLLPTEEQWEFAARGTASRKYPWGDSDPTCEVAHFAECEPRGTIEVMTRHAGATPEGIHDLAGNVWEWVMPDWFDPRRTPVNDESRRLRGGSFQDGPFLLRASNRNKDFPAGFKTRSDGFRVVWPLGDDRD